MPLVYDERLDSDRHDYPAGGYRHVVNDIQCVAALTWVNINPAIGHSFKAVDLRRTVGRRDRFFGGIKASRQKSPSDVVLNCVAVEALRVDVEAHG